MVFTLISRLFDPIIVFGVIAVIGAMQSGMSSSALGQFILITFFGMILPPVAVLVWAIKTHRIGNWDISNRQQRVRALTAFTGFLCVDLLLVYFFGNSTLMTLFLDFCFWFIGFFAITLFWKVSGHVSTSAFATGFLIRWFGWSWWPVLFVIPLLAWVRVKQHNHTPAQTIVAAIYSWSLFAGLVLLGMV